VNRRCPVCLSLLRIVAIAGLICFPPVVDHSLAQQTTFAGNSQHTAYYVAPAQHLQRARWIATNDITTGGFAHYGAPLITPANTVLLPVNISGSGFRIDALDGATGRIKYTLTNDYVLPSYNWTPVYQPVLAMPPSGPRLYYAGAGGTIFYIENLDSDTPATPVRQCFYTNLDGYLANATNFNKYVFINTPITADTNGVIFFGFRVENGTAPAPLNTTNSGFARIDPSGNASYVLAGPAANDPVIYRDSHNCAPALSNDGATLYVAVKGPSAAYAYLLGLDSTTLATKYRRLLLDAHGSTLSVLDDGTASPMIGPDGEVFFGVRVNNDEGRGLLMHFSADLSIQKPPGGFGWDHTPAVIPTNMVRSYKGTSSYLLFSKYNNYAGGDNDAVNKMALLDPNAAQMDPHPSFAGLVEMREVLTVAGCTPDSSYQSTSLPYAVREWCINSTAVNPATSSVFAPSEDGRIYRWNLASNSLTEVYTLGVGIGAPYVPTVIGPDGTVYTIHDRKLFALGSYTNISMNLYSSAPDLRAVVATQAVTFTAVITNLNSSDPIPTGSVTFQDMTYQGLTPLTNSFPVPLAGGIASITISNLLA